MDERIRTVIYSEVEELQRTVEELLLAWPNCYNDEEFFTLFKQIISLKNTIKRMSTEQVIADGGKKED